MDEFSHEIYYEELNRVERIFYDQYHRGEVSSQTQFDYAWCLIRSRFTADIKKGVMLMEELCIKTKERDRDFLYFLAVGNAKLKEYGRALKCIRACASLEPGSKLFETLFTKTPKYVSKNHKESSCEMHDWGEIVKCEEIKEFEMVYYMQLRKGVLSEDIQFNYAHHLVRSKYPADIKKGILFLEKLCEGNPENLPDILYNLAIGYMRLKENIKALKFIRCCLNIRPNTDKYRRLENLIVGLLKFEGYHELLLAGGVIFVYVSLFLVGLFIYKKTH